MPAQRSEAQSVVRSDPGEVHEQALRSRAERLAVVKPDQLPCLQSTVTAGNAVVTAHAPSSTAASMGPDEHAWAVATPKGAYYEIHDTRGLEAGKSYPLHETAFFRG